jgi:hypothetical protein
MSDPAGIDPQGNSACLFGFSVFAYTMSGDCAMFVFVYIQLWIFLGM